MQANEFDIETMILKPHYSIVTEKKISTIKQLKTSPFSLGFPYNISIYEQNQIILSDNSKHRVVKINSDSEFLHFIGKSIKGSSNGQFREPMGIYVNKDDRVYICDSKNDRVQIFNGQTGNYQSSFGSDQYQNFIGGKDFDRHFIPYSLSIDSNDRILVNVSENRCTVIFDESGQYIGKIVFSKFTNMNNIEQPFGIVHNTSDHFYICDYIKNRIVCFDRNYKFLFDFGSKGQGNGQFNGNYSPQFIAINIWDQLMISDSRSDRVSIFDADGSFLSKIEIEYPWGISCSKHNSMIAMISGFLSYQVNMINL